MSVQISKQVMMDKAFGELQTYITKVQCDNQLNSCDMEMLLYKALTFIKSYKEDIYSRELLQLANQLVEKEETGNGNDQSNNDS